jgi:hypothetical protein
LRNESLAAATIMTAMGNENSSISMFCVWSVTMALSMASSILSCALFTMRAYSGLSSSVVFRSSSCTCFAASGVKGYFAQSVGVRIRFCPSAEGVSRRCGCYSTSMRGAR